MTVRRTSRCETTGAVWRSSSYSNQAGGDCVEAATAPRRRAFPVRDGKAPGGAAPAFPAPSWAAFIRELSADFSRPCGPLHRPCHRRSRSTSSTS
ncbi:DUF397 domain-containing protein [Streptomyces aidingensis]|uniref:DUF397 domain-containing protein n=1 Tax=Streptomyces aidingensis TaxID=910347 RepID=UPI000B85E49E|nr:DUF397 domain-containing protein [Streptomyces aidingensis]